MPASAGTSTAQNPTVTFAAVGTVNVTLTACNGALCSTPKSRTVTVLDPSPAITLATTDGLFAGAIAVHAGELVHLMGNGTGKPPLAFTWQILSTNPAPAIAIVPGSEGWWDTTGIAPGTYSAALRLTNGFGDVTSTAFAIIVQPEEPLVFYTLTPCRLFDSRTAGGALVSAEPILISTAGCGIPASARALSANLTVIGPTAAGKVNLYPGNYPIPPTAEISFRAGVTRADQVIVAVATSGAQTLAARAEMSGGGTVHVIVDVSGYFAPAVP